VDRAGVAIAVGGEDEARGDEVDDRSQPVEIVRDQCIGGRKRGGGDGGIDRGKGDGCVVDGGCGEGCGWSLGGKSAARQRRGEAAANLLERLAVAHLAPTGRGGALR